MKDAAFSLLLVTALAVSPALAEDGQDLGQAAADPTAPLMAFQFQNLFTSSIYGLDETANQLQFRAVVPFEIGGLQNIARMTVPYVTDSPSGTSGFADITLFNLVTFDRSWGRFGVGAVALLPTGSDGLSAEKWGLGPAAGFTVQKGKLLWGLFNQNIFTVGGDDDKPDVNISTLQPIVNLGLGNGWSIGNSEMTASYDWDSSKWTSLPVGVKVAHLERFGGTPVQFSLSSEYNFADDDGSAEVTWSATVKVLLPKG
jgi:hypothetical protein